MWFLVLLSLPAMVTAGHAVSTRRAITRERDERELAVAEGWLPLLSDNPDAPRVLFGFPDSFNAQPEPEPVPWAVAHVWGCTARELADRICAASTPLRVPAWWASV